LKIIFKFDKLLATHSWNANVLRVDPIDTEVTHFRMIWSYRRNKAQHNFVDRALIKFVSQAFNLLVFIVKFHIYTLFSLILLSIILVESSSAQDVDVLMNNSYQIKCVQSSLWTIHLYWNLRVSSSIELSISNFFESRYYRK
jgi:hypothetical protein